MKILVVYYSRDGRTRKVAERIAQNLKADLQEIAPLKGYKGFFGFFRAGSQAMRGKIPAIKPLEKDPAGYDLIIFGTPIWASRMSSPLRAAITEHKPKIKKYAFYCVSGDENQPKAEADVRELIGAAPVAVLSLTSLEVIKDKAGDKIAVFLSALPR